MYLRILQLRITSVFMMTLTNLSFQTFTSLKQEECQCQSQEPISCDNAYRDLLIHHAVGVQREREGINYTGYKFM